jgi:hypothetical protein
MVLSANSSQYISLRYIPTQTKGLVRAFFDTKAKVYKIVSETTNEVVAEGTATSPHKLKLKIKKALEILGAIEEKTETRTKCVSRKNAAKKDKQ